jgi:hypothetical protein
LAKVRVRRYASITLTNSIQVGNGEWDKHTHELCFSDDVALLEKDYDELRQLVLFLLMEGKIPPKARDYALDKLTKL